MTLLLVIAIGGSTVAVGAERGLPATRDGGRAGRCRRPEHRAAARRPIDGLDVGTAVSRVSLTSADIADALVTSPNQLLINGKMPGTISMFVWDRAGALRRYEIIVQRDLARLSEQLRQLFPGEPIDAQSNGKNIVLSGSVTSKDVIEKAVNVAAGYVDKRDEVVPLLQLQAGAPSNQVLLRVRFAEVSRSAMTELGASLVHQPDGVTRIGVDRPRTTTAAVRATTLPDFETRQAGLQRLPEPLPVRRQEQLGARDQGAPDERACSRAWPSRTSWPRAARKPASSPVARFRFPSRRARARNLAISVMFKEFGIRLTFTPTVIGNRVHLKVKPEVSTLDFGNAVMLNGFRIPALSTRRTETELELENGQTFAIAGLMNNTVSSTMQKIPGIGDIPILGLLFKSKAAQKNQTELVVMITPEILPNNSRGVTPNLPRTPEPFMPPLPQDKSVAPQPPAFGAVAPRRPDGDRVRMRR